MSGREVEVGEHGAAALLAADREDPGVRDLRGVLLEEAPGLPAVDREEAGVDVREAGARELLLDPGHETEDGLLARADGPHRTGRRADPWLHGAPDHD